MHYVSCELLSTVTSRAGPTLSLFTCGNYDRNILYKYREAKLTEEYGQRTRCNDTLKTENAIQKKILHQKDIQNWIPKRIRVVKFESPILVHLMNV